MDGKFKLPLTQSQLKRIKSATNGLDLRLSVAQLKHMEKTGGFLPLAALIPLIAGAVGGIGGLAGGVASAVNSSRSVNEQQRHNKAIEEKLGSGIVADTVGKIPLIGGPIKFLLEKIGLGTQHINKINRGGCVKCKGYVVGSRLYLSPSGDIVGRGLFISGGDRLFLEP